MQRDKREENESDRAMRVFAAGQASDDGRRCQAQQYEDTDRAKRIVPHRRLGTAIKQMPDVRADLRWTDEIPESGMFATDEPPHEPECDQNADSPSDADVPGRERAFVSGREKAQRDSGDQKPVEDPHASVPDPDAAGRRGGFRNHCTLLFRGSLHAPADHRLTAHSARPPHLRGGAKTAAIKTNMRRAGKDAGPPERFVSGSRPDRPACSPA